MPCHAERSEGPASSFGVEEFRRHKNRSFTSFRMTNESNRRTLQCLPRAKGRKPRAKGQEPKAKCRSSNLRYWKTFMSEFLKAVQERVVIYDGAMGTNIQFRNPVWTTSGARKAATRSWC